MADSSSTVTMADITDENTLATIVEDASDKELVDVVGPNLDLDIRSLTILQDSDMSKGRSDETEAVNPLFFPVVSSCLFDYMDVAGLINARLVCKTWADAGAAKLIKKATLYLDGAKRGNSWNSFSSIMGQTPTNRFQKYKLINMKAFQLESIFNSTGQHMKALWPFGSNFINAGFLRSVLLKCSNLEDLIIFCPDNDFTSAASAKLFLPQHKKLTFRLKKLTLMADTKIHSNILMKLLNACPELKRLQVYNILGESSEFSTILLKLGESGKIKLEKLDELKLGFVDKNAASLFGRLKLNLSALEIYSMSDLDKASVEEMLEHVRGTLKSFTCDNFQNRATFPLTFPANMTKLTRIVIRTDKNYFFVEAVKSALKLPNLDTLLLSGFAYFSKAGYNIPISFNPDFDTCWRLMKLDANTARCPSLKTLQIPFGLTSAQIFNEIATVFPNVTDLRLHNSSADVIASVFANYSNLERLSIKMHSFPHNLDSVLTGLKTKWCKIMLQNKKFKFANPAEVTHKRPGLKDMKSLKYFELLENVRSSHLTEVTLYHGLWYLTRAVQIDLQGCEQFTERGIEELKSALGPCCFLNISSEEEMSVTNFWTPHDKVQLKFM